MANLISKKPCIDMCDFNKHDVCKACGRTHEEKKSWKRLSDHDKQAIWTRILASHGNGPGKPAKALRALYRKAQDRAANKH